MAKMNVNPIKTKKQMCEESHCSRCKKKINSKKYRMASYFQKEYYALYFCSKKCITEMKKLQRANLRFVIKHGYIKKSHKL